MAPRPDTVTGTITLTSGSTAFTTSGTNMLMRAHEAGDSIIRNGLFLIIAEITGENSGVLFEECPYDAAGTDVPVCIRFQADGSRIAAATRNLMDELDNGNVQSFATLVGPGVPVFNGEHNLVIKPETDFINGVRFDVQVNTLADRAAFNSQPTGFAVLVANVGDGRAAIYSKNSNASADWSAPAYVTGPVGPLPTVTVDTTMTLAPGAAATVVATPILGGIELDFGIPAGRGLTPKGTYNPATAYVLDDAVLDNGSTFIALQPTIGNAPPTLPTTSNAYWQLLARKGTDGTGVGDVVGPASSVDQRLAVFEGTSGKIIEDSGLTIREAGGGVNLLFYADDPSDISDAFPLAAAEAISTGGKLIIPYGIYEFPTATTVELEPGDVLDIDWNGSTIIVSDPISWEQLQIKCSEAANGCTVRMRNFHMRGEGAVAVTHWGVATATYNKNIGLLIDAQTIELENYALSDIWGKALNIGYFSDVTLRNGKFREVGGHSHIYTMDAYGNEDSFGDAIYFNRISGDARVVITDIDAEGMLNTGTVGAGGGLSRAGIVFEQDATDAASLTVEVNGNVRLHNFERTFHFESIVDATLIGRGAGDVANTAEWVHTYLADVTIDLEGWTVNCAPIAFSVDSFFLQQVSGRIANCVIYNPTKAWNGDVDDVPSGVNVRFENCDLYFGDGRLQAKNSLISVIGGRVFDYNDDAANTSLTVRYEAVSFSTTMFETYENVLSTTSGVETFYACNFTNQRPSAAKIVQACRYRYDAGVAAGSCIRVNTLTTDIPRIPNAAYRVTELDTGTVRTGYVSETGSIYAPGAVAAIQAGSTSTTVRVGSGTALAAVVEILQHSI